MRLQSFPRLCVSSTGGGGGKTLLALGLGRLLARRGELVKPFKKGPDFIDAAWLARACGQPATNLDPFFLDAPRLKSLFIDSALALRENPPPLSIIEGNRGLYDGLDESGSCSTASVARALECPILLCLNCAKSTRTVAAIIRGLMSFESGLRFGGVVLNQIGSARHEQSLRRALAAAGDIQVLGALPRLRRNPLPERHMGLASTGAEPDARVLEALDELADLAEAHCDIEKIQEICFSAPPLRVESGGRGTAFSVRGGPRIGYAHDEALWFYYPENLAALRAAGAETRRLSLLDLSGANRAAWENLDGLYLGGGFPEDFAERLSRSPFLPLIKSAAHAGMPIYAECGGLILLAKSLAVKGARWPMAGVFDMEAEWTARPRGLGYVAGVVARQNPFFREGTRLRGHEFHYSFCRWPDQTPEFALRLERGRGLGDSSPGQDGALFRNVWAAYTHIFAPACAEWASNFVEAARRFARAKALAAN